jgi:DnaJ like chaperone protein
VPKKFTISNLFDSIAKMMSNEEDMPGGKQKENPQQRAHRLEIESAVTVLAAEVIRCNKNFSPETEKYIRDFYSLQFDNAGVNTKIKDIYKYLESGTEPYIKIACKALNLLTTHESRITILKFLFGVAASDDFLNAKETRAIQRLSKYLTISDKDFKEIKLAFVADNNPYKVLGIEEGVAFEAVKTAYRKMILKHHPDKKAADISEEEATLKFKEIQKAFEVIKGEMGVE